MRSVFEKLIYKQNVTSVEFNEFISKYIETFKTTDAKLDSNSLNMITQFISSGVIDLNEILNNIMSDPIKSGFRADKLIDKNGNVIKFYINDL